MIRLGAEDPILGPLTTINIPLGIIVPDGFLLWDVTGVPGYAGTFRRGEVRSWLWLGWICRDGGWGGRRGRDGVGDGREGEEDVWRGGQGTDCTAASAL
jgi:hypothetical protein